MEGAGVVTIESRELTFPRLDGDSDHHRRWCQNCRSKDTTDGGPSKSARCITCIRNAARIDNWVHENKEFRP